jgi:hypothetical protein
MPIGHPCEENMDPFPMDNRLNYYIKNPDTTLLTQRPMSSSIFLPPLII